MTPHSPHSISVGARMICAAFFGLHDQGDGHGAGERRSGRVIHGNKLGRQLGIPTANIALPGETHLRHGVYAMMVEYRGREWAGAASWGTRPHFDDGAPLLEVHLLDFKGDLYGRQLTVEFVRYLRPEQAFASLDAMMAQIGRDIEDTRRATQHRTMNGRGKLRRDRTDAVDNGENRLGPLMEGGVFA